MIVPVGCTPPGNRVAHRDPTSSDEREDGQRRGPQAMWPGGYRRRGTPVKERHAGGMATMPRIWFYRPSWWWHGWSTLSPIHVGGDEYGRRTLMLGWTITGRVIVAISKVGALYEPFDL